MSKAGGLTRHGSREGLHELEANVGQVESLGRVREVDGSIHIGLVRAR